MKADTHTPFAIFSQPIRYVVPLFQRPYVWNLKDQWEPLWLDVCSVAQRILDGHGSTPPAREVAPHFLGAIVLDAPFNPTGYVFVRHIVDGQQRLTTLQLLMDAAQEVMEKYGDEQDAQALRLLVLNDERLAKGDDAFKVWPTDRDQQAFRAAMDNGAAVSKELMGSRIAQAHTFFADEITEWALCEGDDATSRRLAALGTALRNHLKLVVIDLEQGDNAQVIFETLNHRGAPLLAADLVKNFLFQTVAEVQGSTDESIEELYRLYWRELDNDYWRAPIAQGRLFRPRIDVFLNYWLTMTLLDEIATDRIFTEFRDFVLRDHPPIAELLSRLSHDAAVYAGIEQLPATSVEGVFYYRVLKAMDTGAVGPLLLWLLTHDESELPIPQRQKALRAIESWMVRRAVCRLSAKDINRMVLDILKRLVKSGPQNAGDTVEEFLNEQTAESRFWPTDSQVRSALAQEPLYRSLSRPRMRMLLEALEDNLRHPKSEDACCPKALTVEHVMPRGWREYWGDDIAGDALAEQARDNLVHTLGNLTLVGGRLNTTLSNRPWLSREEGKKGKYDYLLSHATLNLNGELLEQHKSGWTEEDIRIRTAEKTATFLALWPRPEPAEGPPDETDADVVPYDEVFDDLDDEVAADAVPVWDSNVGNGPALDHTGRYRALWLWLGEAFQDEMTLTFEQVEDILGGSLPPAARQSRGAWQGYDRTALGRAIHDAGWSAERVDLVGGDVTFARKR